MVSIEAGAQNPAKESAEAPPANGNGTAAPRPVEVRLSMSTGAAQHLSEPRVRRLLEIELGDNVELAATAGGPLGDHVAYLWIDEPTPARVIVEVRIGERPVARREVRVAGMPEVVAARFVVVAAAELVRTQMQPIRPRKSNPGPRKPTPEELEVTGRAWPALVVQGAVDAAFLPSSSGFLAGPSLSVGFRRFGVTQTLTGRWLAGDTAAGNTRWLELALGAEVRFWLSPSWRIALGAQAGAASLHLSEVRGVDGIGGEVDSWSARAGGILGLEARPNGPIWVGLALEPGAILRPLPYQKAGAAGAVEGAFLGARLTLSFDHRFEP